jgi:hypothetical protein
VIVTQLQKPKGGAMRTIQFVVSQIAPAKNQFVFGFLHKSIIQVQNEFQLQEDSHFDHGIADAVLDRFTAMHNWNSYTLHQVDQFVRVYAS